MAAADDQFKSGVGYWSFNCDNLPGGAAQCGLAVRVDCGVWRMPAVDGSVGSSQYTDWVPGPRHFDDVKVTFLMDPKSAGLYKLAHDIGMGTGSIGNRFNFTLQFKNVDNKGLMHIDYVNASIVGHTHEGYNSTAHGEAAEESIIFKANKATLVVG